MKVNMTILFLMLCLLACKGIGELPSPEPSPDPSPVRLHTVMEMNRSAAVLNSHQGEELYSVLQPMYGYYQTIPHDFLTPEAPEDQNQAIYPRIKCLADGSYIMFYHGGKYGTRVWCSLSSDFKTWSTPQLLFGPQKIKINDESDTRRFVNPDAVVLPGGDILLVCSYRASSGYNYGLDCGLAFRRSSDNGKSWSEPWLVEVGPNWEPYMLLLPDGRIQCYYTDATPQTRNSGTSVITSEDGGLSWSAKKRVCRLYKYDYWTANNEKSVYNGEKIFTDQMPCFRLLNDGRTLVGWLEDRIEEPAPIDCAEQKYYSSRYEMSLVYHDGPDWEDLGEETAGPEKRLSRIVHGAAGYISVFPSGETVLSCAKDGFMHLRMCNASVTDFYGGPNWEKESNWLIPFDGKGFWGATEVVSPAIMAAAIHCDEGMQTGLLYLNHRIVAAHQKVVPDGDCSEWETDKAFFLGLKGGDELLLRAATDGEYLYLAADCLEVSSASSTVDLILFSERGGKTVKLALKNGISQVSKDGITTASRNAVSTSGERGYTAEAAIPLSLLNVTEGDTLLLYATFGSGTDRSTFSFSKRTDSSTWQRIKL